ncbi:MAG: phage holin family protein [Bacteroidales bacterium]|nr:phage holin family protein [Bacteroidales bacterium]
MDILGRFTKKSERGEKTWSDAKTYFSQRYDLLKLEFLEKSTQLLSVIFSMLIIIVCALVVVIYLSSAIIHWLTTAIGAAWAYTILCALFIGVIVFVFAKKDVLFVKPLIRKFSRIMYPDDVEAVDTENVIRDVEDEYASRKGGQHE